MIILTSIVISASIVAETVYKKTNPDGSVTFTDQPSTDSKEVKIRKSTTYKPIGLPHLNLPSKKLSPSFNYELAITQPTNDATITGQHNVTVSISVKPTLKIEFGHQIRYQISNQTITSRSTSETFKNVSRGTHSVNVSIVDQNGSVVSPTASSLFHMKRFFKKPVVTSPPVPAAP